MKIPVVQILNLPEVKILDFQEVEEMGIIIKQFWILDWGGKRGEPLMIDQGLPTKKISNSQGCRGSNSCVESINWDNLISGSL
jgi:hypothetical protein